jgi:hypothetical protein
MSAAEELDAAVRAHMNRRHPGWQQAGPPAGMVLQLHPQTVRILAADPEALRWTPVGQIEDMLSYRFGVPVQRTEAVQPLAYRLVIITEDEELAGMLHMTEEAP